MDPADLERLIDAQLKQLPAPQAPATLLPRVLAAACRPAPWHARPWLAWPRPWQVASATLFVALGIGAAMVITGWPLAPHAGSAPLFSHVGSGFSRISSVVQQTTTLARALWQVLLGPAAFWLLAVTISLSLACALFWSALERVAVGETK